MGRHSAPDDEPDDAAVVATATLQLGSPDLDVPRGRHARPGGGAATVHPPDGDTAPDEQRTQMIAVVDPEVAFDDTHTTDEIVPPPPFEAAPVGAPPAPPTKADRKAAKAAAKAAEKAAAKAAAKARRDEAKAAAPGAAADVPPGKAGPKPKPAKQRDGETDTQADLRVLRENSAVRARSIAAVLVSFVLYTVVIVVIGRAEVYLLWIWIPIVVAGVLVGIVLDLAHRSPKGSPPASPLEPMG